MGKLLKLPIEGFMNTAKKTFSRRIQNRNLSDVIKANASYLYERGWKQRDRQGKSVYNVTITGKASVATLELIANKAGIPAWYLLVAMPPELLESNDLDDLVTHFVAASAETRQTITHLLKSLRTD